VPLLRLLGHLLFLTTVAWLAPLAAPSFAFAARNFDLKLDDRVDPVAPGDEMVFEVDVKIRGGATAPGVSIELLVAPELEFVEARSGPLWEPVPAEIVGAAVRLDLGDEPPCGDKDLPVCSEVWAVFAVDPGAAPGTVFATTAAMTSTDPDEFPTDSGVVYTSVGSLALRSGRVVVDAGRVQLKAHVGRSGMHTPFDPSPPNIDLTAGLQIRMGEAGEPPVLDVFLPADALRCVGRGDVRLPERCFPDDPEPWRALGIRSLKIFKNGDFAQRINAVVRLTLDDVVLPPGFGPELELVLEANGVTYEDVATFEERDGGRVLVYSHTQLEP
jgi:hypothetical protein